MIAVMGILKPMIPCSNFYIKNKKKKLCHYHLFRRFSDILFAAANAQMTFKSASLFAPALCEQPEQKN